VICINIKGEHSFQGGGIGGRNKVRLNQNGRHYFGPHDYRYKTNITGFLEFQKFGYVGEINGFFKDMATTISGILNLYFEMSIFCLIISRVNFPF
jgi:hypothetical protein